MSPNLTERLSCRWVPGTLDTVLVEHPYGEARLRLADVKRTLGREVLQGLYLSGRYHLDLPATRLREVLRDLGLVVTPRTTLTLPLRVPA
ncbi:hypothetical protein [Deinococcus pimensis]|uniref:hypothetical protein n=1 Tax=Deinococcus pimensis TaxID=309888 RepID=UPI000488BB53|nr:hypothetical protein [Deinococcus pimensis]